MESVRKTVTIDQLSAEAKHCAAACRAWRKDHPGDDECAEVLARLRVSNKEFTQSYPIVIRYMAMGEYSDVAFRKYITWVVRRQASVTTKMSTVVDPTARMEALEIENLHMQAEYAVFLYRETHNHWNATHISNLRANIQQCLRAEHAEFKRALKQAEGRVDALEKMLDAAKRDETAEYYRTHGPINPDRVDVIPDPTVVVSQVPEVAPEAPPQSADMFL